MNSIVQLDRELTLALNGIHSPVSDWLWMTFSAKLVWVPLYLLMAWFIFKRLGTKRGLWALAAVALTFLLCDQFSNLVKDSVGRLRPCHDDWMVSSGLRILEGKGGKYGFFSAHAANALGLATVTTGCLRTDKAHTYRWYAWAVYIWAVLVGISRVFVGKHFLGDVLVGAAVGIGFGLLAAWACRTVTKKAGLSPS